MTKALMHANNRYPPRVISPSPLIPAVHLLLDGLGKTALGVGLLLGHAAAVVERRSPLVLSRPLALSQRDDRALALVVVSP